MLSSNSQIQGLGTTVAVELLALLALAFAVVSYVEWSSNKAVAEFMSASDPNQSAGSSAPVQPANGRTGCPKGKKVLPTQLAPLP
ncbi:hypothetical protein [Bradyrhizobium sp. BWA-3-5]|uniref:hypothetical protein n=1 Tax=Bradyrhizobium sp. BWA-3-5 TaxID=3080013 RepID=UPI00293F75BE|nr:hypothetical protein [Bradyrhizobium sp. BWA-3-5]WOH68724.1 hypothetical protein RX331_13885 [Bradyrhizobium sp. BWA-3-5]